MIKLTDKFNRHVNYLRVSTTDRCNFRCFYCLPEVEKFLSNSELLSLEELYKISSIFISLGIKKIRISGGEPLVRKDILKYIDKLGTHLEAKKNSLEEITLTTNGALLKKHAKDLYSAGIKRINVSLDTLDDKKFTKITRGGNLATVLNGIDTASKIGLRIKINLVALKGYNDNEVNRIVSWCGENHFDISFIEVMPMGIMNAEERAKSYWSLKDVKSKLDEKWRLSPSKYKTSGPSIYYDCEGINSKIGFITPLSNCFCQACNRVRLTCNGMLYLCLGHDIGVDLKRPLRQHNVSTDGIVKVIKQAILLKPEKHNFIISTHKAVNDRHKNKVIVQGPNRRMNVTGG